MTFQWNSNFSSKLPNFKNSKLKLLNYLWKMRGYPQFSFWIPISLSKICFSCTVINRVENTWLLGGTVLNWKVGGVGGGLITKKKKKDVQREANRPFPSCFEPHYESKAKYKVFVMKIGFHSYASKINFHMKRFALFSSALSWCVKSR